MRLIVYRSSATEVYKRPSKSFRVNFNFMRELPSFDFEIRRYSNRRPTYMFNGVFNPLFPLPRIVNNPTLINRWQSALFMQLYGYVQRR